MVAIIYKSKIIIYKASSINTQKYNLLIHKFIFMVLFFCMKFYFQYLNFFRCFCLFNEEKTICIQFVNIEPAYIVINNTVYNRASVVRIKRNKNNVINAIYRF